MNLNGLTVMVTRPRPNGEALCACIEKAHGKAVYFPTIDIERIPISQSQLATLEDKDWLIFISPQAVYTSSAALQSIPLRLHIAAVGAGTALALEAAGFPVEVYPDTHWSSEGLVNLPSFQSPKGQKIVLVRGEGGRDWLATTLTNRGADVTHLITYRRCLPKVTVMPSLDNIDIITCTSSEGLLNLKELLKPVWSKLRDMPILVTSEAIYASGEELGYTTILLAKNASHDAIMIALQNYIKR